MKAIMKFGLCYFLFSHYFMMNVLAVDPTEISEASCETLLGPQTISYLSTGFVIIQIVGVVLTVILGLTDFMGAILAGDNDANKKAIKKFVIRLSMMAVLLIVPSIIKLLLTTFGISDDGLCIL